MMKKNNFSVLMSLYHRETANNLIQCLDSLVCQTLKADEVVLVLDGPVFQDLVNVYQKYVTSLNLKIIPLEKNVGLGRALNHGLQHCSYDVIARMDTDDICEPHRFECQIAEFDKDPSLVMVGSGIIEFDDKGEERLKKLPLEFSAIRKFSEKKNPFNHMSVMFRKEDIIRSGSYIHHYYMEDYNLWLRLIAENKNIINIDAVLVKARVDSSTMLKRRGFKYIHSEIQLYKLKRKLKISTGPKALIFFIMRVIPRLLPVSLLKILYSLDRH
ncbi:glycosyltransferase [Tatumella sp. UBA2305]|uniref:glycosyltransferase n=1 Tax=Tatumella sp. UBA2305 TaxID=1947647 RepID=UPI0025D90CC1|nr:glycosyltransferase [Tatumella sp. UBA2305]